MTQGRPVIADLHRFSDEARIEAIGQTAARGNLVGVLLERDKPEKIERYIAEVTERFPAVRLVDRFDGPTDGVVTLRFGPKATQ